MNKAWYVQDEEYAVIVFAPNEAIARSKGAWSLTSELEDLEVKPSPEYEEFAAIGYVPVDVLINNGWWHECNQCGRRVEQDWEEQNEDMDEDEEPIAPIFERDIVFCCPSCKTTAKHEADIRRIRKSQARAVLRSRYPGIHSLSVYSGGSQYSTSASFKFPSGKHTVKWSDSDPDFVMISRCDLEAWQKFKGGDRQ